MSRNLNRWLRSRTGLISIVLLVLVIAAVGAYLGLRSGAGTVGPNGQEYVCLPTCSETDGRFFSLAGAGLQTLAGDRIRIEFAAPSNATAMQIGIFDGDTTGVWDFGAAVMEYTLYADPAGNGTGTEQVGQWMGNTMTNNGWYNINITPSEAARAENGVYYYHMVVRNTNPAHSTYSNFKVRTDSHLLLVAASNAFSFMAALTSGGTSIIYPSWPALTPTTYDGTWDLYLNVTEDTPYLAVWDGDFDYGSADCTTRDTDDADTINNVLPQWAAGTAAVFEGLATSNVACTSATGTPLGGITTSSPPDDNLRSLPLLRSPNITYQIITPSGATYVNNNPSGNTEWEQFRIDSDANVVADHQVAQPFAAGVYRVQVTGLDMTNLNAWRFEHDILGICANGQVCKDFPDPTKLGDYVWLDENQDGIQDADEPGIPDVAVVLKDGNGQVIDTHTTDSTGFYETFLVEPGTYEVTVDETTLPDDLNQTYDLDGTASPNTAVADVTGDQPNLEVDFGYVPVEEVLVCEVQITHPQDPTQTPGSGGFFYAQVDPDTGDVYIRYTQSLDVNDNSYGDNEVNWPGNNHKWNHLVTSDQTRFEITDANGNVVVDLYMDYISANTSAPTGYRSMGPTANDGSMNIGDVNWIYDWKSSMEVNLERYCAGTNCVVNGVDLLDDSPPTVNPQSYDVANADFSDWIFPYWIEFNVSAAAFGGSTFGGVELTDIHNSPAKMGNDQFCVGGGCGVCIPAPGTPRDFAPPTAPIPDPDPIPTPTLGSSHVSNLTISTGTGPGPKWNATVMITVVDNSNTPLANATVSGDWSGGMTGTAACITDANGQCTVFSGTIHQNQSSVTFTVSSITHASATYDPTVNISSIVSATKP